MDHREDPLGDRELESETGSESSEEPSCSAGEEGEAVSWISWFCSLKGNEFFCEVDEDFVQDDFNLSGLGSQVPYYEYALDTILDSETLSEESLTEEQQELVENAAEALYGLIHARFIISQRGLAVMAEKYKNGDFGRCPRYYCQEQNCLPVGLSDQPHQATVKLYCPRCQGLYYPRYKHQGSVDGAYFGSTFAHFLLLTYPSLRTPRDATPYTPRVWGFKLHETALLPVPDGAKQGAKAEPASKKEGPPRNSR